MQEIEDNFKSNGGKFGEFRIGDLFRKIKTNKLPYKAQDLKGKCDENYNLPALTAGVENQGLAYFVPRENATILKNVISVSANGANTGVMFYQSKEFTVLQDSYAIEFTGKQLNKNEYLYMIVFLQKVIRYKYDWSNKAGWERIKNVKFALPTQNGEIAFDYMEAYIKELEADRVKELEAYLIATGLKDYTLTAAEQTALETFEKSIKINNWGKPYLPAVDCSQQKSVQFQEFKIGELFEKLSARFIGTGDKFKSASKIQTDEYCVPLVYAKSGNNGIMYWAKQGDFETHENVLSVIYNGAIAAGLVYAQPKETGILAESYFIKLKQCEVSFKVNLFLKTALEKTLYPKYSREYLATWTGKVEHDKIQLPTQNNAIDFDFMHTFIRAIEKIVIKEVVEWADKKIQATKQIINRA